VRRTKISPERLPSERILTQAHELDVLLAQFDHDTGAVDAASASACSTE
jgi:hypothetical protein